MFPVGRFEAVLERPWTPRSKSQWHPSAWRNCQVRQGHGAPMGLRIAVDDDALRRFCETHGIAKLSFLGSVLRPDFGPDSDVDVLVVFAPGRTVGFFDLARMEDELGSILGRRVDLRTPEEISRYFRSEVLREAEVHFAQG